MTEKKAIIRMRKKIRYKTEENFTSSESLNTIYMIPKETAVFKKYRNEKLTTNLTASNLGKGRRANSLLKKARNGS
jgi:hypothetical protein